MRDVLGWRKKFGVLGPSTNTIVQPDFEMMRPLGVTNHYSRIFTPNAQAVPSCVQVRVAVLQASLVDPQ